MSATLLKVVDLRQNADAEEGVWGVSDKMPTLLTLESEGVIEYNGSDYKPK